MIENSIQLGDPVKHRGLVITPLFPLNNPSTEYLTLEEALPLGFSITEVDAAGSVPELLAFNPLDTPVLFALPRAGEIRGNLRLVYRDIYGSLTFLGMGERISYAVSSDISSAPVERLKADNRPYPVDFQNFPDGINDVVGGHPFRLIDIKEPIDLVI